jgi:preprotein translocase subunit SecD
MLQHWRILLLVVTVFGSILAIGFGPPVSGVEVVYVQADSPANGLLSQGMVITHLNGERITSLEQWNEKTENLAGPVSVTADKVRYDFTVNDTLGIDVMNVQRFNLDFGLDLRGGTRITLTPKENATKDMIDQVVATLQTRANVYGLKEIRFYSVRGIEGDYFVQIEATGVGREVVDELLSKQGSFEAWVDKPVDVFGEQAIMELGDDSYTIGLVGNKSISLDDRTINENDNFTVGGINFRYINRTSNRVSLAAEVYTGKDIELVYSDPQHSGVFPRGNIFQFYFVVLVSQEGAQRFADVTTGIPSYVDFNTGERYLDSKIYLYIDGQLVSDLQIGETLGGQVYTTPQIQGSRVTMEEAIQEKLKLQTILRSGALPTTLETSSIQIISPTLGSEFFNSAGIALVLGALVVTTIVFVKYRRVGVAIPIVLMSLSEVVIILGIAAVNDAWIWSTVLVINFLVILMAWWKNNEVDMFAWAGALLIPLLGMASWTIDLPAIGGILAAIGTGVDHQIIIADETISGKKEKQKSYTIKDKIKMAFFIIFGASATTIAAMVPLMSIGIGLVRGFAITTIIGVLVGILITRPAYARIVEIAVRK